ncbi:MAG: aldo/keto reductase [Elusimicrobia bacterium RIFCSPLOWO2_02_FULL_39_32]|nr:MAG: aldo/keto reductase [Elusimicrobia bacterium RIFCSPHIGHO2_02_FULL_39_36]OGR91214.1 MAG: aldo/keto reductase [Elusimicrobia bacterium RIFCSPLOWO2_02_FULL_39_32]OGS00103.1 MAG: aldo/keto reductase [Elusimicrobia bacterium RIFCSPLOWO2_12_FULL_39_28]
MNYRILGKTNLKVSEIGFGAWAIGGGMWGKTDDEVSLKALRRSLDLGVNFIDTAAVYGKGHSEQLIAKVYRERKGKFFVATKIPPKNWQWPAKKGTPIKEAFPADWIREQTEKSLRNLKMECVDLQQLHVWAPNWVKENDWYETLLKLKQEGKIRFIGVSLNDHAPDEALELVQSGMADSVQVIYNIFDQSPEDRLFLLCKEKNVGVIARVPLDEGSLTGKFTKDKVFEEGDWRRDYFSPDILKETVERVEKLKFLVSGEIKSLTVGALKFCLSHPTVSTVIPGIRSIQQAEENISSSDGNLLSKELLEKLKTFRWVRD